MAIWKAIKGFDNQYWISDEGQVISLGNDKTRKTKILKARKNRLGYLQVNLHKDGKQKTYLVHRLVAEAFIPNPDNLPECNHIDECKTNNRVENIEYCDRRYNINYGTRTQRQAEKMTKPVLQFDLQGNFIKEWASATEFERQMGKKHIHISECCLGKYKQSYGYVWKYKEERAA